MRSKSAELLDLVEGIAAEHHVKKFINDIQPHLKHHADRFAIGRYRPTDPESSDVHVTMVPKNGSSIHRFLKTVGQHIPIAGMPHAEPRQLTALFFRSGRANGIRNTDHHIQLDISHQGRQNFDDWFKDKTARSFDAVDSETQKLIDGKGKSKKDSGLSDRMRSLIQRWKV